MKPMLYVMMLILIGLLPMGLAADDPIDLTGPQVVFNSPSEGSYNQIDAAHPHLMIVFSAEDASGVKQGILRMKAGHQGYYSGTDWIQLWGHTWATGGTAPHSVRENVSVRMLGRPEGEYTFMIDVADMARHNGNCKILHAFIDTHPPTVSITSPRNGAIVCSDRDLRINVDASDTGSGIGQIQVYLNAVTSTTPVAVDTTAPYQLVIPRARLVGDPLKVIVRAIDKAGRSSQAEISVRPKLICAVSGNIKKR